MSDIFSLSESSTKEDVANYLCTIYSLKDEVKNILINEYISGDVLPLLSREDFKNIGIRLGPTKKINKFIEDNKSKFKEKEIKEKITSISGKEDVKTFFEECLEFKGELNNLDGKGLLELNDEKMKLLGLKLGQRKRLQKYIQHFKSLDKTLKKEEEIYISRNSSEEEVSKFLKIILKFSEKSINELLLDGETLFDLNEKEIDKLTEITLFEKENLKKFLRGENIKEEKEESEIKLNLKSTLEEICIFLEKKLNFSKEVISNIQ